MGVEAPLTCLGRQFHIFRAPRPTYQTHHSDIITPKDLVPHRLLTTPLPHSIFSLNPAPHVFLAPQVFPGLGLNDYEPYVIYSSQSHNLFHSLQWASLFTDLVRKQADFSTAWAGTIDKGRLNLSPPLV